MLGVKSGMAPAQNLNNWWRLLQPKTRNRVVVPTEMNRVTEKIKKIFIKIVGLE